MRLISLLLTASLVAVPVGAQPGTASSGQDRPTKTEDKKVDKKAYDQQPAPPKADSQESQSREPFDLPVSLDRIKDGLGQEPALSFRTLDVRPTFRIQILERQKIEELLATLNFKTTPAPAGGLYWSEVQRQMWPSVDHPLNQPYAAFNQGELLTILIENLVGKYLAGKAANAITAADRSRAENAARDEVHKAIQDYCAAQPNSGAGIQICTTSTAIR